jgi:cytochrome c peroxidase
MKRARNNFILLLATAIALSTAAADLQVKFIPQFNGEPLAFDALRNQTGAGQKISVTRLDFLASDISLRRADGIWIGKTNWFAFISARDGKTNFTLENIPGGNYGAIRFQIGLPPQINHADAAQWPPEHPLNPQVNNLYWSWSHEYVFLALEGIWSAPVPAAVRGVPASNTNVLRGFSYHLATDRELMTVELPVALDLNSSREVQVGLDIGKIFTAPNKIALSDSTDTSHSRTNDLLAAQLRQNVENAFTVIANKPLTRPLATLSPPNGERDGVRGLLIAPNATPYHLTISKFAPQPDLPRDNPLTGEGVALGSKLFFDRRLSSNDRLSCAACHRPNEALSDPRRFSRGVAGAIGTRNAPALENLAWKSSFFWDGRAATLREQVLQPIQNPIEMHDTLSDVVAKVSADNNYPRLFANAFGSPEITSEKIARALEQFLLVQVSFDSKYDRVMNGQASFSAQEQRGFELFNTEYDPYHGQFGADCFHCHGGVLFQSQNFANNGLDAAFYDLGRYKITKRAGDEGKFSVPSLRNVAITAPYMHDGRFRTLDEAVEHYCTGMKRSATLDPNLAKHPDGGVPLSADDKRALVAFLKTLTDEKFLRPAAPVALAAK